MNQIVNTLGFVDHIASATTTQPCYCMTKEVIDNMEWVSVLATFP
jgi:hypothetical protein